ncbi:Na+/H+ antiporter NhaA [Reyranella sp.]|uniref:Na+/H+ antiporter NhaA n=1 Tax=Reyranella sp. TaxID=1929291 RepID=UPI003BAD14B3
MSAKSDRPEPDFPQEPISALGSPLQKFLHTETSGGLVLLVATVIALALANSPLASAFESIWQTKIGLRLGDIVWDHTLRHWINDGLVTIFFFVVGLELKREIVMGELRDPRAAVFSIAAAIGGMLVPAALYLVLVQGVLPPQPQAAAGWGTVMATDIAFAVGCMALLGRRVPVGLRVFVLALAIVDDIGAILVIAFGYSHGFEVVPFGLAVGGLLVMLAMRALGIRPMVAYWAVGVLIWLALEQSGVHPTLAGVAIGVLTPVKPWVGEARLAHFLEWARSIGREPVEEEATPMPVRQKLARAAVESLSPQQRLESALHPWSAFLVLPLFALANAGVGVTVGAITEPIALAIVAGLAVGKPLGVFIASWLAVRLKLAHKQADISWPMVLGAGALAGIGFTMSLFIATLAFDEAALRSAKVGILAASLISGVVGMALLLAFSRRRG